MQKKENFKQITEKKILLAKEILFLTLQHCFQQILSLFWFRSSLNYNDILFIVLVREILEFDWLEDNKHSWHIIGVHDFTSYTVKLWAV